MSKKRKKKFMDETTPTTPSELIEVNWEPPEPLPIEDHIAPDEEVILPDTNDLILKAAVELIKYHRDNYTINSYEDFKNPKLRALAQLVDTLS